MTFDQRIEKLENGSGPYRCAANEIIMLRAALENLLDVFERCEAGFPPEIESRFLARDIARNALSPNARGKRND